MDTARTAHEIGAVLAAARDGRVDALFIRPGAVVWGRFDETTRAAATHAAPERGDEDLVNAAVIHTLATDGDVYVMPPDEPGMDAAVALLRY